MTTETNRSRAQLLEAHYQALVDAALQHEQVIEFLANLYALLWGLNRSDVEVRKEAWLENKGVIIKVTIGYDALYPGQAAEDPAKNARMQLEEATLLNALREGGVNIGNCFGVGRGGKTKTHYDVLRVTMNYQGEILPASPTSPI